MLKHINDTYSTTFKNLNILGIKLEFTSFFYSNHFSNVKQDMEVGVRKAVGVNLKLVVTDATIHSVQPICGDIF